MKREKTIYFTLIEMLVVVAIIAILAALLMPSLNSAMDSARAVGCQNNYKQIGYAIFDFAENNAGRCPGRGTKMLGSGGSVAWHHILNATSLKDATQIGIGRYSPNSMSCPNADYFSANWRRYINMNYQLTNENSLKITDQSKWPGPAYGGSSSANYYLGALISGSRYPSKLISAIDMESSSNDVFNSGGVSVSAVLQPSVYAYNKYAGFSFRHNSSMTNSRLHLDGHSELANATYEEFSKDYMKYKP